MSNFVDYVKIHCKSGHGGAGSAHLRREKYIPKGGPDGGDGGRGGHVIMRGNAQEWTLLPLRYTRHIKADRGQNGAKSQLTGADGDDIYIDVPIGTSAKNEEGEIIDMHNQEWTVRKAMLFSNLKFWPTLVWLVFQMQENLPFLLQYLQQNLRLPIMHLRL
jgi:Obg family GTPase CgtA